MELKFTQYWNKIQHEAELDGMYIGECDPDKLNMLKKKAKSLYNKDVDVYDAFEQLYDLF